MPQLLFFHEIYKVMVSISGKFLNVLKMPPKYYYSYPYYFVNVCAANVGTLKGKWVEVGEMIERIKIDICCIQEIRFKGGGCRYIGNYKLWWSGGEKSLNVIGVVVRENLIDKVIEVERHGDRIIKLKLVLEGIIYSFISASAPQVGRSREEKERFWICLSEVMEKVADAEQLIIGGDSNGHVGDKKGGFERVLGKYTYS